MGRAPVIVIGLSGKMHAGKNTVANELTTLLNRYPSSQDAFAVTLKRIAGTLTADPVYEADAFNMPGVPADYKNQPVALEGLDLTKGQFLVTLGDALRRAFGDDVLVKAMNARHRHRITAQESRPSILFVTDVRLPEEAAWVNAQPVSLLLRVEGDPSGLRAGSTRDPRHRTETALDTYDRFDFVIDNHRPGKVHLLPQLMTVVDAVHRLVREGDSV